MIKRILCVFALAIALSAFATPAQAQCEGCVGVVVSDWTDFDILDFNGNGFTTFDLVVLLRFQANTGLTSFTMSDLVNLVVNQVDVNGDMVYDANDFAILQTMAFFINATGLSSINIDQLVDCGRRYILGTCP